jgi:hypothetical protein
MVGIAVPEAFDGEARYDGPGLLHVFAVGLSVAQLEPARRAVDAQGAGAR